MLSVLLIFVLLALFLALAGWLLFLLVSMDAVYREARELYWSIRYKEHQQQRDEKTLAISSIKALEALPADAQWEDTAVTMWRDGRELSAVDLVQKQTKSSFEEAHIKLLKMNEEVDT